MRKVFYTDGRCVPGLHYMVDLSGRLRDMKCMVDNGSYFTINRARQYGKTTTLAALAECLRQDYEVVSLDFQMMSYLSFADEQSFVAALSEELLDNVDHFPEGIADKLTAFVEHTASLNSLQALFKVLKLWCEQSERSVVLMIDEVDTAANNQVFLDFLAQLRAYYLKRPESAAFQSVILAGVYDVRNVKRKLRPEDEHGTNSPWNIAADFLVDMSFSVKDIAGMLTEYEKDQHTGMDVNGISELLYDYTSGYPYLVSRLCKFMDERIAGKEDFPDRTSAWTKSGLLEAVKLLVSENNMLYQSLVGKLTDYPELRNVLYELLFAGRPIPYVSLNQYIEVAAMFGFIKNEGGNAVVSNRIFETVLYNLFLSEDFAVSQIYDAGVQEKNQFIVGGHLNVRRVLEKFVEAFEYLYGDQDEAFLEKDGRKYFMLFLKPIINGTGNCYVESETRNHERMDLVIDYRGEQSIIELKVWRGDAYNRRGEEQLSNYLDHFGLKKGYMLSYNFNKNKETGIREIVLGDKVLIEAVV
ncbi:MAG: AAA-like domain-containing protein [Lachnospiraceae bacterium]|nr:AAA-like domain-containing protein [Lachnospiraceae bacterium]